jgi:hypothetical protein
MLLTECLAAVGRITPGLLDDVESRLRKAAMLLAEADDGSAAPAGRQCEATVAHVIAIARRRSGEPAMIDLSEEIRQLLGLGRS